MCNCLKDLIQELCKEFAFTEDDDLDGEVVSAGDWYYRQGVDDTKERLLSFLAEWGNK